MATELMETNVRGQGELLLLPLRGGGRLKTGPPLGERGRGRKLLRHYLSYHFIFCANTVIIRAKRHLTPISSKIKLLD